MKLIRLSAVLLVTAISFLGAQEASAQVEIGVKVSPSITYQRFVAPKELNLKSDGASVGIGFGVIADYFFGTNYAFHSGVVFNVKGGSFTSQYTDEFGNNVKFESENSLHYIEIPLALKLYTNEVAPDIRAYFTAGGTLNTMVGARIDGEKVDDEGEKYTKQFNLFEVGAIVGAGAEWQLGESTKFFGGLTYQHGLTDVNDSVGGEDSKLEVKNSLFSLDFGIKF